MISTAVKLEILAAVEAGHMTRVEELVDRYGLYETEDYPRGSYLLTKALLHKHPNVAMLLLRKGAEVNCRRADCTYACFPLHLACKNGYQQIARELIERGANVNLKDNRGRTPLYYCDNIEMVELLLVKDARFDTEDFKGNSPLHHLLFESKLSPASKLEMLELFVGYGADPISTKDTLMYELIDHFRSAELLRGMLVYWKHKLEVRSNLGETVLHYAARLGRAEEFKVLVEEGADVNARDADGSSPLHIVVKKLAASSTGDTAGEPQTADSNQLFESNDFYKIMIYLVRGCKSLDIDSIDDNTFTALHYAVQLRCPYAAEILLAAGANYNAATCSNKTPLSLAVANKDGSTIRTLLIRNADLSVMKQNNTLIFDLIESSVDLDTFETALNKGKSWLDLEARMSSGDTALLHAVRSRLTSEADILIIHGARLDSRDAEDMCPLHLALDTFDNHSPDAENIVDILLHPKGRNTINMMDKIGTPLHRAIQNDSPQIVSLLIAHGADVNLKNLAGETPLLLAATGTRSNQYLSESVSSLKDSDKSITHILLDNGANIFAPLMDGKTVIHKASSQNLDTIIGYIISHGLQNQTDTHGNTALHCVCETEIDSNHAERLIRVGRSDPNSTNDLGETPLHLAIKSKNENTVQVLLKQQGIDVTARTNDGLTPVHFASQNHPSCSIKCLAGSVDSQQLSTLKLQLRKIDGSGKNATHHAVSSHGKVDELVRHGAGAIDSDYGGKTPLDLALDRDDEFALRSLLNNCFGYLKSTKRGASEVGSAIDEQLCDHQYVRLYETSVRLWWCIRVNTSKKGKKLIINDKFMLAATIESSLCIPKSPSVTRGFDIEKLYWFDGKTSPDCVLMKLPIETSSSLAFKLFEANLPCGKELVGRLSSDIIEFDCAGEVASLKRAKIDEQTSLYDFLHDDNPSAFKSIFKKSQDKDLRRLLYLDDFPIYRRLILSKIWRDSKRIELLFRARTHLLDYMNVEFVPDKMKLVEIADNILSNFTNFELMLLIGWDLSKILVQHQQ